MTYKVTYRTRGETVTAFSQLSAKEAAQKANALEAEGWKHVTIRPETEELV